MPVYNTKEEYFREAIESILNQTFKDFEIILIDDASDETTKKIIRSYNDDRIKVLTNEKNLGVTKSLNRGLSLAQGKYIARMDSDDVAYPERFEKQVAYLDRHPDIGVLGTYVYDGEKIRQEFVDINREERETLFLLENVGPIHPSVMLRKSFLDLHDLKYDEAYPVAQDYDLWIRCSKFSDICFCEEPLLTRRKHPGQIGKKKNTLQHEMAARIKTRLFSPMVGNEYSEEDISRIVLSATDGGATYAELCTFLKLFVKSAFEKGQYDRQTVEYVAAAYKIAFLRNNYKVFKRRLIQMTLLFNGDYFIYREYRKKHIRKGNC